MVRNNLGTILYPQGRVIETEEQFCRTMDCCSNIRKILYNLGVVVAERVKLQEARRYLHFALQNSPDVKKAGTLLKQLGG